MFDDGDDDFLTHLQGVDDFTVAAGPLFGGGSIAGAAQAGRASVESGWTPTTYDPTAARLEELQTRRDGGAAAVMRDPPPVTGSAVGTPEELAAASARSTAQTREAEARAAGDYVAGRYWAEQYDEGRARAQWTDDGVVNYLLSGRATAAPVEWLAANWGPIVREAQARRDGDVAAARYWAAQVDPARAQRDYPDAVVRNYLSRLPTSAPLDWVQSFLPPGVAAVGTLPGQTPAQWDAARSATVAEDQAERARRQAAAASQSSPLPAALASLFTGAASSGLPGLLSAVLGGLGVSDQARQIASSVLGVTAPQLAELTALVQEQQASLQATAEHRALTSQDDFRREVLSRMWTVEQALRQLQASMDLIGPARY